MLVIPAIDLKDGQCVRLRQGIMEDSTVFSNDPVATAALWQRQGARRLHLVDLNGAFEGEPVNAAAVEAIAKAQPDLPIQIGGGIRDLSTIERYLNAGVTSVIIGARTEQQFADNLAAADFVLSEEENARLEKVSRKPLPYPYWHQCKTASDRLGPADMALFAPYLADQQG